MKKISFLLLALAIVCRSVGQPDAPFSHWREDKACMDWVNKTYDILTPEERIAQ